MPEQVNDITRFFCANTGTLITKRSYKLAGWREKCVGYRQGVLRGCANPASRHPGHKRRNIVAWLLQVPKIAFSSYAGITLKKPEDGVESTLAEAELFNTLDAIYTFYFLDIETGQVLRTQTKIETQIKRILDDIEADADGNISRCVYLTVALIGSLTVDTASVGSCPWLELLARCQGYLATDKVSQRGSSRAETLLIRTSTRSWRSWWVLLLNLPRVKTFVRSSEHSKVEAIPISRRSPTYSTSFSNNPISLKPS